MMHKTTLIGRLTRDVETRDVGDSSVARFGVAVNQKFSGKEYVTFYDVDAWGKLGDLCAQYISKGRLVYVEGEMRQRTTDDGRVFWTLNAREVKFLDRGDDADKPAAKPKPKRDEWGGLGGGNDDPFGAGDELGDW